MSSTSASTSTDRRSPSSGSRCTARPTSWPRPASASRERPRCSGRSTTPASSGSSTSSTTATTSCSSWTTSRAAASPSGSPRTARCRRTRSSELADRLVDALAAAHRQGIVHRDIKPANVLFDAAGQPHLADFGAASSRDVTLGLTGSEMVVGTPGFMSPEQARGEPATAASDVFSLGATLAFAATGSGPVRYRRPPGARCCAPPPARSSASRRSVPGLAAPTDRAHARQEPGPAARPPARLAGGPAGTHPRTATRRVAAPPARTRPACWSAVAAIVLAAVIGLIVSLADGNGSSPGRKPLGDRPPPTPAQPGRFQPCGERPAPHTDGGGASRLRRLRRRADQRLRGRAPTSSPDRSRIDGLAPSQPGARRRRRRLPLARRRRLAAAVRRHAPTSR